MFLCEKRGKISGKVHGNGDKIKSARLAWAPLLHLSAGAGTNIHALLSPIKLIEGSILKMSIVLFCLEYLHNLGRSKLICCFW